MEDLNFDKFMDDLLVKEAQKRARAEELNQETPQREYVKRYREKPLNKIKVSG